MSVFTPRRQRRGPSPFLHRSSLCLPGGLLSLLLALLVGCESKMEQKECDKIRGDAFEMINKAQHCNADPDCHQSAWPGCAKPVSQSTLDQLKPMSESYKKGKCDEPKIECKAPPESYCKQGLCVHRELGAPQGAGNTPTDQIQIQ